MFRTLTLLLLAAAGSAGQTVVLPFDPVISNSLKKYLQMTEAQVEQYKKQQQEFLEWSQAKHARVAQVQAEIAMETAKSPLDPMALGTRYAEVEAIRRDIADHASALRAKLTELWTPAQKALLKALEDARNLQPLISESECLNFLGPASPVWIDTDSFSSVLLGSSTSIVHCAIPYSYAGAIVPVILPAKKPL